MPTPSSIGAYIEQSHLRETLRLEFVDPRTKGQRTIEDRVVICQVLDLLESPDKQADSATQGSQDSFLLLMVVPIASDGKPVDHTVFADYDPKTGVVSLENGATGRWPISLRGRYTVPPSFGMALFEILDIDP